jgi:PRTRC genetic system protein A
MIPVVGYVIRTPSALRGQLGQAYNYVMAGNGLLIQASGPHFSVQFAIAEAKVRGLPELGRRISMKHGRIPRRLFDLAMSVFLAQPDIERFVAIYWDGSSYRLEYPEQNSTGASVKYRPVANTVIELHSHASMPAFFSATDNRDEQGLKLYGVVGRCDMPTPVIMLRVGVYGYFALVDWSDVFEGFLDGVAEARISQEIILEDNP